jgi:hypothetical protein
LDHDLWKADAAYSYVDRWNGRTAVGQHEAGGTDFGAAVTWGYVFDL